MLSKKYNQIKKSKEHKNKKFQKSGENIQKVTNVVRVLKEHAVICDH